MKHSFSVAVAQLDCIVGDVSGNADRIIAAIADARAASADLLLTPELAVSGYPPEDLLLRPDFYTACEAALVRIAAQAQGVCVIVGHPARVAGRCFNAASVFCDGECIATYHKHVLPNFDVFDEKRYFDSGEAPCVFSFNGVRIGLCICADIWEPEPVQAACDAGAEVLLVLNASPFHVGKQAQRQAALSERVCATGVPILYCNSVGGQDELVFDGGSCALNRAAEQVYQAASFRPVMDVLRFVDGDWAGTMTPAMPCQDEVQMYEALKMGVRAYVDKNGFPGVIIGLSGGIDSALTVAIAVDALGADKVQAVMLPSPYTQQMSLNDSREMVRRLGVRYAEIPIQQAMTVFAGLLAPQFTGMAEDVTEENLQSRIRGVILMALSNKTGAVVLTTGNKSEMATGYATLYGDMAGGFAVLKDVYKTWVYRLAEWRNMQGEEVIPRNVIERPPSAELKPGQVDQDSLPPYAVLDAVLEGYIERNLSVRELVEEGFDPHVVRRIVSMLKRNEYKRRQAPIGVRVTACAFGKDWRYPVTARYQDPFQEA